VLLGYLALAILMWSSRLPVLQVGLASLLAVFGSGFSTLAVLFPRSDDLDVVERAALSACLSLAIGGIMGFALAGSPWGLTAGSFLVVTLLYNVLCGVLAWYRKRNVGEEGLFLRLEARDLSFWRRSGGDFFSRCVTVALAILFLSGAWVLTRSLDRSSPDPAMTEFYLLGQGRQTEGYPETGQPGEELEVTYGIVNRENAPAGYQVKSFIQGAEVGSGRPMKIDADQVFTGRLSIQLPEAPSGRTKVEFVLYREGKPYRLLHLWIDIDRPVPRSHQFFRGQAAMQRSGWRGELTGEGIWSPG